ncbi:MAG: dephospho-CoA kinase [bacterium]|nr:dephospho-CoA kinase [bacterium]
MLRLGITGGIGSGKTLVCSIFQHLGVPVYNADTRAKWLINNHSELKSKLIKQFGEATFKEGLYNTAHISAIVFGNPSQLALLNDIIHPIVFEDWKQFCNAHNTAPLVIKEAAIMLETDSKFTVDKIALVYAPLAMRMQRVIVRDGLSEMDLMKKIKSQMPEEDKLKLVDFVIINDGEESLIEQVKGLYKELLSL